LTEKPPLPLPELDELVPVWVAPVEVGSGWSVAVEPAAEVVLAARDLGMAMCSWTIRRRLVSFVLRAMIFDDHENSHP
jgi:hypothetical protein